MEETRQKYTRFIEFLEPHINNPIYKISLQQSSYENFTDLLKKHSTVMTTKELTADLAKRFDINLQLVGIENVEKFIRYIEYFKKLQKL